MTKSLLNLMLFLVLSAGPLAHAQDDEPQKPEDVYRYAAFDTGDAIEVDWAISDGYYLYRNKLAFESATDGIVFSAAQLPQGLPHEDEFFGKQQIYRCLLYTSDAADE